MVFVDKLSNLFAHCALEPTRDFFNIEFTCWEYIPGIVVLMVNEKTTLCVIWKPLVNDSCYVLCSWRANEVHRTVKGSR